MWNLPKMSAKKGQSKMKPKTDVILEKLEAMDARMQAIENELSTKPGKEAENVGEGTSSQLDVNEGASPNSKDTGKRVRIPVSLKELQEDASLQDKVRQRTNEIMDSESESSSDEEEPKAKKKKKKKKKKGKSGQDRTANDKIKCDVDWPHFYVYKGPQRSSAKYKDLTLSEFVYGFTCQLKDGKYTDKVRQIMLTHLNELMADTSEYGFEGPKTFHAIILREIEHGRLSWTDRDAIQRLRVQYSQKTLKNQGHGTTSEEPRTICPYYSKGYCRETKAHKNDVGVILHHICQYCYKEGLYRKHSSSKCMSRPKNGPHYFQTFIPLTLILIN